MVRGKDYFLWLTQPTAFYVPFLNYQFEEMEMECNYDEEK